MEDEQPKKSLGKTALDHGKKAAQMADKAAMVAESTSNVFGAIKWVAIAVVTLTFAGGGYMIYKAVTVPAKAVGDAAGAVTETVKSGAGKIKDSSSDVLSRLIIPVQNQTQFNAAAEAAFERLNTMAVSEPEGVKDRLFRAKNFSGHDGRICALTVDFGAGDLPVTLAADNEGYATSKALGSKNDRLIRMLLTAGDDTIGLRAEWDGELQGWVMKWKATTLKKPVEDSVAADRMLEVLGAAAAGCE